MTANSNPTFLIYKMRLHPEASNIIDVHKVGEEFKQLRDDNLPFKRLQKQTNFKEIEKLFEVDDKEIIHSEIFNDPVLFSGWNSTKIRNELKVEVDINGIVFDKGDNKSKSKGNDKYEKVINNRNEKRKRGRPARVQQVNEQEEEKKEIDLNKYLLHKDLSMNNKIYILDNVLEQSGLQSVNPNARESFSSRKKIDMNLLTTNINNNKIQVEEKNKLNEDTLVYCVDIYKPNKKPIAKYQSFIMLDTNTLQELRDRFYCIEDFLAYPDLEAQQKIELKMRNDNIPKVYEMSNKNPLNSKDKRTSSSYFFIEGTFYIDFRNENNVDYSKPIIKWSKSIDNNEINKGWKNLNREDMSLMPLNQMNIRLNQPYLFCHQGDCNHILIFREIRLIDKNDEIDKTKYPINTFKNKVFTLNCRACGIYKANHITVNDIHAGESPTLFCDHCYVPFHFDKNNQPFYSFFHYPYAYE